MKVLFCKDCKQDNKNISDYHFEQCFGDLPKNVQSDLRWTLRRIERVIGLR